MAAIKFKRFTKPQVLQRTARGLLEMFLSRFQEDLAAQGLELPGSGLDDAAYCQALAGRLLAPEGLPDRLNEVLFAVDEMATPEGQERLLRAVVEAKLELPCPARTSAEDLALQVWLAAPALLARAHNEQRLRRLSAFEHFGAASRSEPAGRTEPDPAQLGQLAAALDAWFARHFRGQQTTRIELYRLAEEYWFLVRHGDTFTRAATVEARKSEVIYFRPEKDDVVVYSPEQEELRINARTRGERELYRTEVSRFLRGDDQYYSERRTYTLEPLRQEGPDALSVEGVEGLDRVVLREIEIAWDNTQNEVTIQLADDLFQGADLTRRELIPREGRLARATFSFQFSDSSKPRLVEIRLPNLLKLSRHCDGRLVHCWARLRGFRFDSPPRARAGHFCNR